MNDENKGFTLATINATDKVTGASIVENKLQTGTIFDLWCWLIGSFTESTVPWYRPQDEPDTKIKIDVGYWSSDNTDAENNTFVESSSIDLVHSEVFGRRVRRLQSTSIVSKHMQCTTGTLLRSIDKHLIPGVLEKNMVIVFPGEIPELDVMCVTDGEVCTYNLIE